MAPLCVGDNINRLLLGFSASRLSNRQRYEYLLSDRDHHSFWYRHF